MHVEGTKKEFRLTSEEAAQRENCASQIEESISAINKAKEKHQRYSHAEKLLNIINDDKSYAAQILDGINPSQIGHWEVSELRDKLWEMHPEQYADKMQDYLINKIAPLSGRDPEYASHWLCAIIDKFPERAPAILDDIYPSQIGTKEIIKLREKLWEMHPEQYADKMQDYLIGEIAKGRGTRYHSDWLGAIIGEFPERAQEISSKIKPEQLKQEECSELRVAIDKARNLMTPERTSSGVNTATYHRPKSATHE